MTILQSAVIAFRNGRKKCGKDKLWKRRAYFSCVCYQGGKKKATPDAVRVKRPRCQEKVVFEFGLPASIADFPKKHHASWSSLFVLLAEKKYWLVGCLEYCKHPCISRILDKLHPAGIWKCRVCKKIKTIEFEVPVELH